MAKFKTIKIEDKELIENADRIRNEKDGFLLLLRDLSIARIQMEKTLRDWFDVVFEKYDIPEKYRWKLAYKHSTHELRLITEKKKERKNKWTMQ